MIRLLIADDHPGMRSSLVDLFESTDDITVVAVCADGSEVLGATTEAEPDVALLDLLMPRMDGLQAARHLRDSFPGVRVLMLSGTTGPEHVEQARLLGAFGFIPKGTDPEALPGHIRSVASGRSLWPDTLAR